MNVSCNPWDMNNPTWLIHKTWAGGNAARVLLFNREQGVVWAKCHGGWSSKKQAILQAFTPLWMDLSQQQSWYTLKTIEIASPAFEYQGTQLFSALYVNELLYHLLRPHDSHPDLYDAYIATLQQLSLTVTQNEIESVLRRFEWELIRAMGYVFSLTHEAGHRTPIMPTHYYQFHSGLGFLLAPTGFLGAEILAMANDELHEPMVLRTAKRVMRAALEPILNGKEIKSRSFFMKS